MRFGCQPVILPVSDGCTYVKGRGRGNRSSRVSGSQTASSRIPMRVRGAGVQTVPQHPFRQWILPPIDGGWRAPLGRVHEFKKQELLGRERQSRLTSQRLRTIEYQGFLGV